MYYKTSLVILIVFILSGCGGGDSAYTSAGNSQASNYANSDNSNSDNSNSDNSNSDNSNSDNSNSDNSNSDNSNNDNSNNDNNSNTQPIDPSTQSLSVLNKAIAEHKIEGWDSATTDQDYYLAITNYLRSLPIKCNDSKGYQGPVSPMKWSSALAQAAKVQSEDMLAHNFFDHYGSDGSTPIDRMKDNGFTGTYYGENIAYQINNGIPYTGYEYLIAFVKWIQSTSGHCSNIMSPNFNYVGMAEAKSVNDNSVKLYWTQDFGKK